MDYQIHQGLICGCSVLKEEVESLRTRFWPEWHARYLNSMLHMNPGVLSDTLKDLIKEEISHGNRIVLVYGDCCESMARFEQISGVARTDGMNCCELILGRDEYRSLLREGVFFLLPEWTHRWLEIFSQELGLNKENAEDLMHEMHTRMVYLDTGVVPVPHPDIAACSRYCGLPYEICRVSPDTLKGRIQSAMDRLEQGKG